MVFIPIIEMDCGGCRPKHFVVKIPPNRVQIYNYEGTISKQHLIDKENVTTLDIAFGKIEDISEDFFIGTPLLDHLIINGNSSFPKLKKEFFRHYPKLTFIKIYNNTALAIDEDAFFELEHLKVLMLDNQKYPHITEDLFKGLDLELLSLVDSKVKTISADAFQTLPNLESLYLSYNKLTKLEPGTFRHLSKLKELWLHINKLDNIKWDKFDSLPSLEFIDLANNKNLTEFDVGKIVELFPKLKKINLPATSGEDLIEEFREFGVDCNQSDYGVTVDDSS